MDAEDVSSDDELEVEGPNDPEAEAKKEDLSVKKAPLLSDIELVSKTISYDSTGTPSVTVIFKVRNSSGEFVKSVNARVQV